MPIEFTCPSCHTRLRVPDDSAGQIAQCPSCGGQTEIPNVLAMAEPLMAVPLSTAPLNNAPAPPPLPSATFAQTGPLADRYAANGYNIDSSLAHDELNPYAAPPSTSHDATPFVRSGDIQPRKVTVREICSGTFRVVTTRLGQCALLGCVSIAMLIVMQIASLFFAALFGGLAGNHQIMAGIAYILMMVSVSVAQAFFMAFILKASLNLAKYGDLRLNDLPQVFGQIPRVLAIYFALTLIGVLVLIVGIFGAGMLRALLPNGDAGDLTAGLAILPILFVQMLLMLRFAFSFHFVLDRNLGVVAAISHSLSYTQGNTLPLIGGGIVLYILAAAVTLITLLIGAIVTMPALIVATSVAYLLVTSQMSAEEMGGQQNSINHAI